MSSFLKKNRSVTILVCLLIFQLILLSFQLPMGAEPSYLEKAIFLIVSPIQRGFIEANKVIGVLWEKYFSLKSAQNENKQMKQELFTYKQENLLLKMRLKKLEKEIGISSTLNEIHESILSARVIGLDQGNVYKSLLINRGTLDGIQKDMVVLDPEGHLIGRVINPISFSESRVQLITDNELGVAVYSQEKEVSGILKGDANGFCSLNYILATDERTKEGQTVFSSGFDGIFPPGIPVGMILSVRQSKSLFKSILVQPFFSFNNIDQVAVIKVDAKSFY